MRRAYLWASAVVALAGSVIATAADRPVSLPTPVYIHEFPHPSVAVSFHPRKDQPFTLPQLEQALRSGVRGVELDLRFRPADSSVVCSHENRDLAHRPTLDQALSTIRRFRGTSATVRGDGLQFFVFLDLKEESPGFHRALIRVFALHAANFSNSGRPDTGPRGITVIVTGNRGALERSLPPRALDLWCVVEGREYDDDRIIDRSSVSRAPTGEPGTFQWTSVEYPVERSRVRAIQEGRDSRARGYFNVRVIGARGHVGRAIDSGADAVNTDLDEIPAAVRHAERAPSPSLR